MESRYTAEKSFVFHVKCASLLVDGNQTYNLCRACKESVRNELSGTSLEWKPRYSYSREGVCSPSKLPFTMENVTNTLTPFVRHAWIFPSVKYLEWNLIYSQEGTWFSKQIVYIWKCKIDIQWISVT